MELIDALRQIVQESANARQETELELGTVTSASPLEITLDTSMQVLRERVLYRTEAVVEKKIPLLAHRHKIKTLSHTHTASDGTTSSALTGEYLSEESLLSQGYDAAVQGEDILCYEDGEDLPVRDGYLLLNRGLEEGDKVLLLRVRRGQKFVVLSRLFEGGSGT